jgi:hypothetical protein
MAFYNFKRNCKVYLVHTTTNARYQLDVYPDLTFSQTFDEQAINVKTLHDQNAMFEGTVVNKANPANFSFTVLLNNSADHEIMLDLLIKKNTLSSDGSVEYLTSFDLYIDTGVEIFKLEKAVLERGTFQIARDAIVTVSVSGSAKKLSRIGSSGTTIPGTISTLAATVTGIIPRATTVTLDSVAAPNISSITLELVNQVEWLEYDTLHKSLNISGPSDTMYPEGFVVSNRTLSGTIVQYLTDTNLSRLQSWSTTSSLRIQIGTLGPIYYLDVNMPSVVFTNRLQTDELFLQMYDFRMVHNPTDLSTVIDYTF